MRFPIDTSKVTLLAIGQPQPQVEYKSTNAKVDANGTPLYRVPVVLGGTGERTDPTTTITVASPTAPNIKSGDTLTASNLVANSWTLRGSDGHERSGVTLRADRLDVARGKAAAQ